MKHILTRTGLRLMMIASLFLLTASVSANDYLELQKHYSVYVAGANSIHLKVPVWAYGRANNYYQYGSTASYIVLTKNGNQTTESEPVTFAQFKSEPYGENDNLTTPKGTAWMKMLPGQGTAVITSTYNGSPITVYDTGLEEFALVIQKEDDDCKHVSMLEFDWYPPESLNGKEFVIVLKLYLYKSYSQKHCYTYTFRFNGPFKGGENLMTPQLSKPYLYTVNASGVTGYGQAAVQYTTFQKPIWYTTSLTPNDTMKISERSGAIYVNTTDTVQEQFTATFGVYRNESVGTTSTLTTPSVDIPPFHRIYDFFVIEEQDSLGSFTGNNIINWEIRNPELKDLVENDYFEIQRATKRDFSDAQTLNVISMEQGEKSAYEYIDNSYLTQIATTTGSVSDTLNNYMSASKSGYVLKDANGNPMCEMKLTLSNTKFVMPSAPLYYRIRRASTSMWGWDQEFAEVDTVYKHNYLAPLAATQSNYRLDANFQKNRIVHFDIKLDNAEIGFRPISIDDCQLTCTRVRTLSDTVDYIMNYDPLLTSKSWMGTTTNHGAVYADMYVYAVHDGQEVFGAAPGRKVTYPFRDAKVRIPVGSSVTVTAVPVQQVGSATLRNMSVSFIISDHTADNLSFRMNNNQFDLRSDRSTPYKSSLSWIFDDNFMQQEDARIQEIKTALKQEVMPALQARNESYGRCIWDRTARLVLCRRNVEKGQVIEFIVPQDSIRRQPDGSWMAHMTDEAGEPCTHYTYSVRIDQTDASVHVSDSTYLNPVPLYGPDLYFDESAQILSFTASQGEAQGHHKNGINLIWQASSAAVDEFVLTRIVKNSDQVPDTILRTEDNNYFDDSAKPNVHYEYTITSLYSCNGKSTSHSATAEGWRTPYGIISGNILMADNSGMSGVQVSLSAGGETLRTLTTDATGFFVFDSLEYDLNTGTTYTVTPTSQYGTFSYNSTSSGAAMISLASDKAILSGINFVNTSSVRLTGRVLYDNSTIPVAGVAFVLNGDTIRRNGLPLLSATDGSFELAVCKSQMLRLKAVKQGHSFLNDGWLFVTEGDTTFSLVKPLDGVRFYDATKVRLVGRVAGGNDQKALKHGFGLGKNNLGDDLQLVLMLEGDNTAHIVHDPDDLTRDSLHFAVDDYSGHTAAIFEQKRIIIRPDIMTGEYSVDLFPVKYKVVQATAKGYATLFPAGTGSETFDLTNAPLTLFTDSIGQGQNQRQCQYNAVYDRIHHNPVKVSLTQLNYGMEADGYGEAKLQANSINPFEDNDIPLYTKESDGSVDYMLGYPVFAYNRRYQFMASAFEQYRYNNDPAGALDRVPQRGGAVTVQNGLSKNTDRQTYTLDSLGRNKGIWLTVDYLDVYNNVTNALRTVSVALESEGNTVETEAFRAFVEGSVVQQETMRLTDADIRLLDIVRDPGGNGSSAYVESGATYNLSYVEDYQWKAGVNINISHGAGATQDIGVVSAPAGAGTYIGATYSSQRHWKISLPIVHEWKWGYKYSYNLTTTDRISTSTNKGSDGVGANADVFLGATVSQLAGKAKTVALITDSLFRARKPAIDAGAMKVLAQGSDSLGRNYYFVTGEKVVLGSILGNTFVYSQQYILQTIIPMYILERQNLLMNFENILEAKDMANNLGEPVYWNLRTAPVSPLDTLRDEDYLMVIPDGNGAYNNRVQALDHMIMKWIMLVYNNEKEKVMARNSASQIATYSVSYGNSITHSDSYTAFYDYNQIPQTWGHAGDEAAVIGTTAGQSLLASFVDLNTSIFKGSDIEGTNLLGTSVTEAIKDYYRNRKQNQNDPLISQDSLGTVTNSGKFDVGITPVLEFSPTDNKSSEITTHKTSGFTLVADDQGDITVSVYRANMDSVWTASTAAIRKKLGTVDLYGSYVFFTQSGSTLCPYEGEERTRLYNPGTLIANATEHIAQPSLSINTYELTNVPSNQHATFRIELKNNGEVETGRGASGQFFILSFDGTTNPDGAKVFLNGAALNQTVEYFIKPGQTIVQTIEVEKGNVDDYKNLRLKLALKDCPKNLATLDFSVHFMPESSPVSISYPRDQWVMNTLSARDSIGYYLPITIDGFNIHHKNFDHIEFQYKLSTENNDAWVNACSFYASDSLYNLASGNKAKIENGRIAPFRFYGERDPKELNYDLRAVSFCRYGSGFVTKASPVISGTKDTRPPVLFGKAQPANGILTLEDNISLRFSEPIAGNWLDEDNNFQVLGVTNTTGITQTTSPYFDGQRGHYAYTKAKRELAITDLTIDMLIKPAEKNREMVLLAHGDEEYNFTFSLTADNRLKLTAIDDGEIRDILLSKPMDELSTTDFTRVIMVHNFHEQSVRFYAGTKDITDDEYTNWLLQNDASSFIVGTGLDSTDFFHGNMMELRIWTKPLTPAEISNTHLRHLTGYEYGLLDYYPMTESKGSELEDLASGATLFAKGLTWTLPRGISLATKKGNAVQLDPTLFSRTDAEDYSLLFWFRSGNRDTDTISLFGASAGDSLTMEIALHNGEISYRSGDVYDAARATFTDDHWHHCALVISKTFNAGYLAVDGQKLILFPAIPTGPLAGTKMWLAKGLEGNIDDVTLFEQALPDELVAEFGKQSPNGEEMGLVNLLTFSQLKRNSASVMELVFSPNNQRVFKDANGNVIHKEQPLLVGDYSSLSDKINTAPLRDRGQLTKLPFTWNYQLSELMVNIKSQPREINKRTMYLTVRDVEDINGNRLSSPVMWTVYVDLNSVTWNERRHIETLSNEEETYRFDMVISNNTGMTRQFTIDHLPDWLKASPAMGTLDAKEEKTISFTVKNTELRIGTHQQMIYLTDDQGLAEPLLLEITKQTEPPYTDVDLNKYPFNMSLCGRVMMEEGGTTVINSNENDIVFAIYNNDCVGFANCMSSGELYLTVHGNETMTRKPIRFQLWKAATGKVYNLTANQNITFSHGAVYGCGTDEPVLFTAGGSEMQNIALNRGWNWISTYLSISSPLQTAITAEQPWSEGDIIKNPSTRQFSTYSQTEDNFIGTLKTLSHRQMYMTYTQTANNMHIFGSVLREDSLNITVRGDGQWNVLPCLNDQVILLRTALGDYYDYASTGDLIKSHDRFATFSADKRWVGDLTVLTPGEGYLFRRMGRGPVTFKFQKQTTSTKANANAKANAPFSNPDAETNMTMIAKIASADASAIKVYISDEQVGRAEPLALQPEETYYFLTIQSDQAGELRFETEDGQPLSVEQSYSPQDDLAAERSNSVSGLTGSAGQTPRVYYLPDSHLGSLESPVVLTPTADTGVYKILEKDHIVIIRNNEKYDVTGKKL